MRARSALLSTGARPLRRRHQASRVRWLCATPVRRARPPTTLSRLPSKLSTPARTTLLRGDPPARLPACRPLRTCRHHTIRIRVAASSVEMGAKKKPKKKPVKKQVRSVGLPLPPDRPAPRSTPMDHQAEPPSLHHRDPRCRATTASCSTTRASRASPATPTPSFTRSASRARAHSTRPTGLISAARLCSARSVPRTAALESSARSSVSCLVLSMCAVAVPSMLNKMDRLKRELLVEFGFDAARKLVRARFERHALLAGSARQRVLSQL